MACVLSRIPLRCDPACRGVPTPGWKCWGAMIADLFVGTGMSQRWDFAHGGELPSCPLTPSRPMKSAAGVFESLHLHHCSNRTDVVRCLWKAYRKDPGMVRYPLHSQPRCISSTAGLCASAMGPIGVIPMPFPPPSSDRARPEERPWHETGTPEGTCMRPDAVSGDCCLTVTARVGRWCFRAQRMSRSHLAIVRGSLPPGMPATSRSCPAAPG